MLIFRRRLNYFAATAHRITGLGLFVYLFLHVWALRGLFDRPGFEKEMELFTLPAFIVVEWLLGICVFYHAFNGVRLVAIELFGQETRERPLFRLVLVVMASALVAMAVFMIRATDAEEATRYFLFSLGMVWLSAMPVYLAYRMLKGGMLQRNTGWKFQRLSGLMLAVLVVGHYGFMHLTLYTGHDYETIIERMAILPVRLVDVLLLALSFWHGAYGARTVLRDYMRPTGGRQALELALYGLVAVFLAIGAYTLVALPLEPVRPS